MVERRLTWLAAIVVIWGAAIFYKLVSIEVVRHQEYVREAKARQEIVVEIPARRGTIFDRTGATLAMSVPTEAVTVNPTKVPNLEVASEILAGVLHLDGAALYARMKQAYDNHRGYFVVQRGVTFEEGQKLRRLGLDYLDMQSETQRHYPNRELAAHVLGGVDFEQRGNAGIEKALDEQLRGQPGELRLLTDVQRRGIEAQPGTDPVAGVPVTLTIDERLQYVAEREIAAAVAEHHAVSGSVVVMDPRTGDVLAMASYPTYDPERPPSPGDDPAARQNHAISVPFEPGSVFKVITLSAALETTRLRPESLINCHGGVITLFGRTIHDSHAGAGVMPMAMVLAKSSNVGAIQVGLQVGKDHMYDYVRRFGFGQKTGVPLPGESRGRLRKPGQWGKTSLASISMGQEISVTTMQLAQAASVVANGGVLVRPRLVLKIGDRPVPMQPGAREINPETAITMRQMMEGVVLVGTGRRARLAGYSVGGKTGSAQIFDFATKRYTHSYNGSFLGFAPLTNPAIVVVATLNGTHGEVGFGGQAAAPVFRAVAAEALRMLDVPKDLPDEPEPNTLVAGNVVADEDVADAEFGAGEPNILEDGDEDEPQGPRVPNFRGMTMRAVLAEAAARGIMVQPDGSGVARVQDPPAGAVLRQGERIRVQFAR